MYEYNAEERQHLVDVLWDANFMATFPRYNDPVYWRRIAPEVADEIECGKYNDEWV